MTAWIWILYRNLIARGNISSFIWTNTLAPFLYGLYLLIGFSSLLWSTNPGYSLLQLSMNIESFVFAYFFLKTFEILQSNYPETNIGLSALLAPAIFVVILSFVIGFYINPDAFCRLTHGGAESRLGGYFMNPNELGMLSVVGIACCIVELKFGLKKWRQLMMMTIMFYALILTGSRSSMIGFMLVAFYFISRSNFVKLKIAVFTALILFIPFIVNSIFIKQGDVGEVLSMTGRIPFWKALLSENLPKEPFFGFGYMRIAYTEAFQSVHTYAGKMTHNTFIQVLMNLGVIGFIVVLLQMTMTLRAFINTKNQVQKSLFIALFIPILINSITEFGIFGEANFGILFYQLLIWLFVFQYNWNFSAEQHVILKKKRPNLYKRTFSHKENNSLIETT